MKVTRKDAMRKSGNESNKKGQFGVKTKQSQSLLKNTESEKEMKKKEHLIASQIFKNV